MGEGQAEERIQRLASDSAWYPCPLKDVSCHVIGREDGGVTHPTSGVSLATRRPNATQFALKGKDGLPECRYGVHTSQ